MIEAAPAVELRGVSKAFDGRTVLDDLSVTVPAGRSLCILGRSGTGKSVTLKTIVGLIRPEAGEVLVNGRDVTRLGRLELAGVRRHIGFLFQNAALFDSITVGENVAFPLRRHTKMREAEIRERVRERLIEVGLEHDAGRMPADLSGGMRKRAGLARAMALDPALLLVDEPSAGLDPVTASDVDALLVRLREEKGTSLVVVTHNIPSARAIADELVFLHEGRILARGTPEEFDRSEVPLVRQFMTSVGAG